MSNQVITYVFSSLHERADFESTVELEVESNGIEETFYVQLCGTKYRPSLGCWIYTKTSDGHINYDDYPDFDIDEIVECAESYVYDLYNAVSCHPFWIIEVRDEFLVCTRNDRYINDSTNPYDLDWEEVVYKADSLEEAKEWIDQQ